MTKMIKMIKNMVKTLVLGVALVFATLETKVEAQIVAGSGFPSGNAVTNLNFLMGIPSNGIIVTKVTIAVPSAATTNGTWFFYDWFAGFGTNLWATNIFRFTNATVVDPFTNTVVFTNSLGRVDTNQYIGRAVFYTNATATNTTSSIPAIGAITVSPGTTYVLDVNWPIAQGLAIRGTNNSVSAFITIEYH